MLSSVTLDRFKCIESATVELDRITVLVGPNNGGKSSFLQGLQLGTSIAQSMKINGYSKSQDDPDAVTTSLASSELVYTPLKDVSSLAQGGEIHGGKNANPILIKLSEDSGDSVAVIVEKGRNRNVKLTAKGLKLLSVVEDYAKPYSVISPGLAGIPISEEYKSKRIVNRAAARGDANSVFRNILLLLKEKKGDWDWFQCTLRKIFPRITVEVEFDHENGETIAATVTRDNCTLPIDSSGTGVLQAIQILSYIALYSPKVLILDEPDSHLHPNNQCKLVALLDEATKEKEFQVVISTHSRTLIEELQSVHAKFVWFSDGKVRSEDFDVIQALMDLGALDVEDYLDGGATQYLILTEDKEPNYIDALAKASGHVDGSTVIKSYEGVGNIRSVIALAEYVHQNYFGTRVYIHRDRDRLDEDQISREREKIKAVGAIPFISSGTDLESHFLEPKHVSHVFPKITIEEAKELVREAIGKARDKSIDKLARDTYKAREKEYFDGWSNDKRKPDATKIVRESEKLYQSDPVRFTYGKSALGILKQLIQQRLHIANADCLVTPSEYIAVKELKVQP